MNLAPSPDAEQLLERLRAFMEGEVYPREAAYHEELAEAEDRFAPLKTMNLLKEKAQAAGLWNLWMPREFGGLSNLDYAPLAEEMGRVLWAPEAFNCNAPDTGNMEVFLKYGTPSQQEAWLTPLLAGEIRSSYCMTEPDVASSDATNIETRIERDGDHYRINGNGDFFGGG